MVMFSTLAPPPLRQNEFTHQDRVDKLLPKGKWSYKVVAIAHPNAFILVDMHTTKLKNTFNTEHRKKLYA